MSETTVTIPESIESHTIKLNVVKEGDVLLYEGHFKKVKIDRYWDSHGRKIYDDEAWPCQELKDVDVKIVNHKQTCEGIRWDYWEMFIDGKSWGGIEGYHARKTVIHIDAPSGHG